LGDGPNSVDIRMAERAGEIRVSVHTPDHELANAMRADLPDLLGKLRQSGFQAEAWRPAGNNQTADRMGPPSGRSSPHQSYNGRKDGRQPGQQQQQQSRHRSRWAEEWKSRIDPAQESAL